MGCWATGCMCIVQQDNLHISLLRVHSEDIGVDVKILQWILLGELGLELWIVSKTPRPFVIVPTGNVALVTVLCFYCLIEVSRVLQTVHNCLYRNYEY
jgi:hypothetical protein